MVRLLADHFSGSTWDKGAILDKQNELYDLDGSHNFGIGSSIFGDSVGINTDCNSQVSSSSDKNISSLICGVSDNSSDSVKHSIPSDWLPSAPLSS